MSDNVNVFPSSTPEEFPRTMFCFYCKRPDEGCTCQKIPAGGGAIFKVPIQKIPDVVNHPTHYTSGGIECIEAIQAALTPEEFRGFLKGNVLKYNWRSNLKNGIEDLRKAKWYLDRMIKTMEDGAAGNERA